jgi:predicted DNA-binding WGR domain protein
VDGDDDPIEARVVARSIAAQTAGTRIRPTASKPVPAPEPAPLSGPVFSEFRFKQGNSDKFWKIAWSDVEVTVVFGRTGTKGSTVVKTFATPERAKREAAKLIAEKVRKGYREA